MKNIFSYQLGATFTGKEIKEFLYKWESDGHSMYGLRQYLKCKDDELYWLSEADSTAAGEKKKRKCFRRVKPKYR